MQTHSLGSLILLTGLLFNASAAAPKVTRVEPPFWWSGFRIDTLQLLIEGIDLGGARVSSASPGVTVLRARAGHTPAHLFVDLRLDPATPEGIHDLILTTPTGKAVLHYPIRTRLAPAGRYAGFDARDAIYLISPDRFANGDTQNDSVAGMREGLHRDQRFGRHGGDIRGISRHLDYLTDLGVTALWITPLIENNNPGQSYHGYAATDLYRIDPRFGTFQEYVALVDAAHRRGLKIILDHVSNHISILHRWTSTPPTTTWFNGSPAAHEVTSHVKQSLTDPHADSTSRRNITDGWFNGEMPDLNQRDPDVATYLAQNSIWWIESTGLDGIREDTYPYADQRFLRDWLQRLRLEYPAFAVVGEVWMGETASLAPYAGGSRLPGHTDTFLPSVTDFPLHDAFERVFGDHRSIAEIHLCLAQDYLYADPSRLMTFLDNHDVRRIGFLTSEDARRTRLAITLLLTLRGMPQLYYGTEVGIVGGIDHGSIRADFPGGFPGDPRDAFLPSGRTPEADALFNRIRGLLRLRKEHPALTTGSMVHFPPRQEVYLFFREHRSERFLVVANNTPDQASVSLNDVRHRLAGVRSLRNALDGTEFLFSKEMLVPVPPFDAVVFELVPGRE